MSFPTTVPCIVVHGGAWKVPQEHTQQTVSSVEKAANVGYQLLQNGANSVEAVESAVKLLEDDPFFDAGQGSCLCDNGNIEMDAFIMEGQQLGCGAVACVSRVKNPISLARLVMEKTPHCLLVKEGAEQLAEEFHLPLVDSPFSLVTDTARKEWETLKRFPTVVDTLFNQSEHIQNSHETVGAVAIDDSGNIACATSTGGITGKKSGRVGDSPLIGCGGYCDNEWGGVSVTGHGESIMKATLSRRVIFALESGVLPMEAVDKSLQWMATRTGGHGGVILMTKEGMTVVGFTTPRMAWACMSEKCAACVFGQPEHNRQRVKCLLDRDTQNVSFQYLVLPEMGFTGYCFSSKKHIQNFVETQKGATFEFCSNLSQANEAYIAAGFPEVDEHSGKYYNSVLVTDPKGCLVHCYRKTFLYEIDKAWAEKGVGFGHFWDTNHNKVSCGICMDINPEDFVAPWEEYEFASYCAEERIQIILFSSAWLAQDDAVMELRKYWYLRLKPLWGQSCVFIGANRIGNEGNVRFAGQSCILSLQNRKCLTFVSNTFEGLLMASY
eukprot:jgi/Galph1/5735/GphlegSOOS_G4389.1